MPSILKKTLPKLNLESLALKHERSTLGLVGFLD